MKKPAVTRAAVPAKKAAPVKAAPKKPAAKKPSPAAAAAHKAHLAHVAHLARIGKAPAKAAPKKRQLALGAGVACCAAEAVAASLRLAGRLVSDADVLALYRRTASDPDTGASIVATLEAASAFGLAGTRLTSYDLAETYVSDRSQVGLLLGVELPGPHAVLATAEGWWSWGELYDPACWPDAVIEEAWTLTWGSGSRLVVLPASARSRSYPGVPRPRTVNQRS
jgi:hypothetical protein